MENEQQIQKESAYGTVFPEVDKGQNTGGGRQVSQVELVSHSPYWPWVNTARLEFTTLHKVQS